MAAQPFIDLNRLDLGKVVFSQDELYETLPHRHEFMQLDRVVHFDEEARITVAIREVREDEFWVRGHIPGRPLLPGVLMIETAAQVASFSASRLLKTNAFLGFAGVENTKFRLSIAPPATLVYIGKIIELKPRRTISDTQAFLDGQLAFESRIIGMRI